MSADTAIRRHVVARDWDGRLGSAGLRRGLSLGVLAARAVAAVTGVAGLCHRPAIAGRAAPKALLYCLRPRPRRVGMVGGEAPVQRLTPDAGRGASLGFVVVVAIGWGGLDAVARRFAAASWQDVGGRLGAWNDALTMVRDFPFVGIGLNTYGDAMLEYQTTVLTEHFGLRSRTS